MGNSVLYGLIGFPLGHSLSAEYFNERFRKSGLPDHEYRLFPLADIRQLSELIIANPTLAGLNVTIPWKEQIIPLLSWIDPVAQMIGAVNTVCIDRGPAGIITRGYNTDAPGFLASLEGSGIPSPALILGTGGASRAISYALKSKGISFTFVSRQKTGPGTVSYESLDKIIIRDHSLIINTTPLGMFPGVTGFPPIPYEHLTGRHFLYDLVYNPPETVFLKRGKAAGAATMNGLAMLEKQAESAAKLFPGM